MRYTRFALAALVLAQTLPAQRIDSFGPEIRPFVGAFVPTGGLRNDFKTATMVGAQAAWEWNDYVHLVSSLSWTHGHAKFAALSEDVTEIWQFDVGGEFNAMHELGAQWLFRPFVGLGAGGRTYDYHALGVGTKTCTAAYGALGLEFQRSAVAFRAEGRNYATCFESPITGKKVTRNDVGLMLGFAYHVR
jgi:hypothetical protein